MLLPGNGDLQADGQESRNPFHHTVRELMIKPAVRILDQPSFK